MVVQDIFLPKTNPASQKSGYVIDMDKQHNLYIQKIFPAPTTQLPTPYQGIYTS